MTQTPKADYILWMSNKKFTGGAIINGEVDVIMEIFPMLKKFKGATAGTLKTWVSATWPDTMFEIYEVAP